MKSAPKPHRDCLSPQELQAKLVAAGIQPTAQRLAISQYVLCEADHPTAEDVKNWADANFPKVSLATVYNTLNTLVGAGLVREVKLPHSESVIYDAQVHEHFHFLDEKSGRVYDIPMDQLEVLTKFSKEFQGLKISGMEVLLKGTWNGPAAGSPAVRSNTSATGRSPVATQKQSQED